MNRDEFFEEKLKGRVGRYDRERIHWAYWLSKNVHRPEKRRTGERYFEHTKRVACSLFDSRLRNSNTLDTEEIILGFIHDCEENGFMPKDLVTYMFGSFVAEGMECLTKVHIHTDEAGIVISKTRKSDEEYFKKLQESDIRIRRVKIADRLDNIQTMGDWTEEKQKEYINETIRYILPLIPQEETIHEWQLGTRLIRKIDEWKESHTV